MSEKTEVNLKSTSGIEECLAFTTDLKSGICNSSSRIVFSRRISKYYCSWPTNKSGSGEKRNGEKHDDDDTAKWQAQATASEWNDLLFLASEEEIRTEQDHEEKKEKGINKQKIFGHLLITIHGPFSISSPLTTMVNGGGGGEDEEVEEFNSQSHLMITCLSAAAHFRSLRFN